MQWAFGERKAVTWVVSLTWPMVRSWMLFRIIQSTVIIKKDQVLKIYRPFSLHLGVTTIRDWSKIFYDFMCSLILASFPVWVHLSFFLSFFFSSFFLSFFLFSSTSFFSSFLFGSNSCLFVSFFLSASHGFLSFFFFSFFLSFFLSTRIDVDCFLSFFFFLSIQFDLCFLYSFFLLFLFGSTSFFLSILFLLVVLSFFLSFLSFFLSSFPFKSFLWFLSFSLPLYWSLPFSFLLSQDSMEPFLKWNVTLKERKRGKFQYILSDFLLPDFKCRWIKYKIFEFLLTHIIKYFPSFLITNCK